MDIYTVPIFNSNHSVNENLDAKQGINNSHLNVLYTVS